MKIRKFIKLLSFISTASLFIFPVFAFAQTQIIISSSVPGTYGSTVGTGGPGAFIANFYQFALIIAGIMAFGAIVYGGIRYMTSAGNPSGQSDAKEWIEAAFLGLLLLAGAYFILKVVNPQLLNLNLPNLQAANVATPAASTATGGTNNGTGNSTIATGSGVGGSAEAASIASAAAAAESSRMSSANGPGGGTVACAWAVNQVLGNAGIAPLDSTSVQSLENALTSGRGTLVDQSQAMAGDIVVQAQDGHVGICLNNGCTQVVSNSSSHASFTWVSNTSFSPSYSGGPGRIYQLKS